LCSDCERALADAVGERLNSLKLSTKLSAARCRRRRRRSLPSEDAAVGQDQTPSDALAQAPHPKRGIQAPRRGAVNFIAASLTAGQNRRNIATVASAATRRAAKTVTGTVPRLSRWTAGRQAKERAVGLRFALLVIIVAANVGVMCAGVALAVGDHPLGYLLLFAPPVIAGQFLAVRGWRATTTTAHDD
jgi:hypothetical protein